MSSLVRYHLVSTAAAWTVLPRRGITSDERAYSRTVRTERPPGSSRAFQLDDDTPEERTITVSFVLLDRTTVGVGARTAEVETDVTSYFTVAENAQWLVREQETINLENESGTPFVTGVGTPIMLSRGAAWEILALERASVTPLRQDAVRVTFSFRTKFGRSTTNMPSSVTDYDSTTKGT